MIAVRFAERTWPTIYFREDQSIRAGETRMQRLILLRIALLPLACALTAIPLRGPTYAQSAQTQYVVVYGEVAPTRRAEHQAQSLLNDLAELAQQANGSILFSVNTEVERPNFFSLVEIWQDATTYAAFTSASAVKQVVQQLQPLLIAPMDERDGNLVE
jgi:quinol monooxygenase YgiN